MQRPGDGGSPPERFATTRWSAVLAAGARGGGPASREALCELCESYWYPLYAYVRRRGFDPERAQDLTQGFFARMLEKNGFADADRNRGRFRSFLLGCLKHYLTKEADRVRTKKRGGGRTTVSFDLIDAEGRYRLEPSHERTPERVYQRRWAMVLLERVLANLREQYARAGKRPLFESLQRVLTHDPDVAGYREIAHGLGMNESAVKVAVHRLRKRYQELLRREVGQTVDSERDVDAEIRELMQALATS